MSLHSFPTSTQELNFMTTYKACEYFLRLNTTLSAVCHVCSNSVTSASENKCTVMSKLSNSKRKRMYVCPHMPCFTKHCLSDINLLFFIYKIIYIYSVTQYSGSCV